MSIQTSFAAVASVFGAHNPSYWTRFGIQEKKNLKTPGSWMTPG